MVELLSENSHDEYVEIEGKQPFRRSYQLGGMVLYGFLISMGALAVFGKGLLQSHFLSQEMQQSRQTIEIGIDETWIKHFDNETERRKDLQLRGR